MEAPPRCGLPVRQVVLLLVLLAVVAIFEVMMPSIVILLAPGFSATPERFAQRLRWRGSPALSADDLLVAFWAALANAHDRFVPGAAMPIMFNFCMIGGALVIPCVWGTWG